MHSRMFEAVRRADWDVHLAEIYRRHRKRPFAWGTADCMRFFCDVSTAMTGDDPFLDVDRWDSETTAIKSMLRAGYLSIRAAIDDRLPKIEPSDARRGDCGYPEDVSTLNAPYIVLGAVAVQRALKGWVIIPSTLLTTAYRIG